MKTFPWLLILGALLIVGGGGFAAYRMTRGIRNNNPGNIRFSPSNDWEGQLAQPDRDGFSVFTDPRFGIRAMAILLRNYVNRYGLNTVRGLITRWAPPSENDTDAYANHVALELGIGLDDTIDLQAHLPSLVKVIVKHENAINPYSDALIDQGIAMAG